MSDKRTSPRVPLLPVSLEAIVDVLEELDTVLSPIPAECPDKLANCRRRLSMAQTFLRIMPREDNPLRIVTHRTLERIEATRRSLAAEAQQAETEAYLETLDLGEPDEAAIRPLIVPAEQPAVPINGP